MTIDELEQQIATARAGIAKESAKRAELTHSRTKALETDDSGLLDRIDSDLHICDTAIMRGRERVELLERRIVETREQERAAGLDAVAARADRARQIGESLIRQYGEHAQTIATLLNKLTAIGTFIAQSNAKLKEANRPRIASPNAMRCREESSVERIERRRLGVGDVLHPAHAFVRNDLNGNAIDTRTNERIERFGEFDITVVDRISGWNPDLLESSVVLPGINPNARSVWPQQQLTSKQLESLIDELPIDDDGSQPTILGKVRNLIGNKAA